MERREEITMSKLGKVKDGPVKVYEVYPSEEPGNTWKRLISVDGKPLSAAELEKNDADASEAHFRAAERVAGRRRPSARGRRPRNAPRTSA